MGKTENDVCGDAFGAQWKIALAHELRNVNAPHAWIATTLNMGKASSVRVYLAKRRN
jgi:hypothetical protein